MNVSDIYRRENKIALIVAALVAFSLIFGTYAQVTGLFEGAPGAYQSVQVVSADAKTCPVENAEYGAAKKALKTRVRVLAVQAPRRRTPWPTCSTRSCSASSTLPVPARTAP